MNRPMKVLFVSAVVGLCSLQAQAARIFFSTQELISLGTTTTDRTTGVPVPGNPELVADVGDSITLHLWAEMTSGQKFTGLALTARTTQGGVVATQSLTVPISFQYGDPEDPDVFTRWDGSNVGTANANSTTLWLNSNAVGVTAPGIDYASTADPTRKTMTGARGFYIGSLLLNAVGPGTTDIFLEVGQSTLSGTGLTNAVFFGTGDAAISNSGITPGVQSASYDARIIVNAIPEPASFALIAAGGLMMFRRRRA